nr:hypothetical protein CPGR_00516 [Mycolicibacterium fortuitum subsp. fortuitum DSM 46621 = ATCC 6841 = JCM 6387]CRL82853.1 hypothetical protein CPGR_06080 [Mycolicibacter nonchromogenicus]
MATKVGSGSALRSILPEDVNGNSSSTTIWLGTMYSGNRSANHWRTAVTFELVCGSLAWPPRWRASEAGW